jgi:hypothetical protein
MPPNIAPPRGDLDRAPVSDPEQGWPSIIEIVAYWSKDGTRKGRRRSIEIDADQFFGRGKFGAPMSGEQLIAAVERLRKQGPGK